MSSTKKVLIGIIVLIVFTIAYNLYFPKFIVVGEYQAHITDEFATNGIKNGDKLVLNDDGTFQSDCWGDGNYTISGYKISFDFGNEGFHSYFNRHLFFGDARIIIFRDLNSEFIKK